MVKSTIEMVGWKFDYFSNAGEDEVIKGYGKVVFDHIHIEPEDLDY